MLFAVQAGQRSRPRNSPDAQRRDTAVGEVEYNEKHERAEREAWGHCFFVISNAE
jgi:hypothetical protein